MFTPESNSHAAHTTTTARRVAAILIAVLLAMPAAADEATVAAPIQAGSLHDGPLDMVFYYLSVPGSLLEVTGTYAPKAGGEPRRFIMALSDGDAVTFAMPGYPQATYSFGRNDGTVTAAVSVAGPASLADARP